jgi:hypothetical protein
MVPDVHPRSIGHLRQPGLRGYLLGILIAVDQLGNALFFGHPDETVSSRLGRAKRLYGGAIPWGIWLGAARLLDELLDRLDPGHSLDAIEERFDGVGCRCGGRRCS